MSPFEPPFKIYSDLNGRPLDNGYVYVGEADQNPTSSPVAVFWDAAGTQPALQPLRTLNGYITRAGTPANIFVDGDYSVLILNKANVQIAYAPNSASFSTSAVVRDFQDELNGDGGAADIGFRQPGNGTVSRKLSDKLRERVSVKDFGAKGDWNGFSGTDDSDAFQAAINYMNSIGGGEVVVPPVEKGYRLASQIWLKSGVRLIGASTRPALNFYAESLGDYYGGYCLVIDWGAGTADGMAIRQSPKSTIGGFTILYPGQVQTLAAPAPIVFPPTISALEFDAPGGTIENLNFVNSYKAIYFPMGHGELIIRHITMQVMNDMITLNGVVNADQITDVNASGIFYLRQSPEFNFTNNNGLLSYIQKNGKAFVIGYADAIRFNECFVGNCYIGLYFGNCPKVGTIASEYAYGDWNGGGMEGVTFPIYVANSTTGGINSNGFRFTSVGFAPVGLYNAPRTLSVVCEQVNSTYVDSSELRAKLTFVNCNFWGSGNWQPNCGPLEGVFQANGGDIECFGCTFKVWQSYVANSYAGQASFKFVGCDFLDFRTLSGNQYHFVSNSGSKMRLFLGGGNDFKGYFGSNFAPATAEIFETPQPYSFGTPIINAADPLPIPAIGRTFIVSGSTTLAFVNNPYNERIITLRLNGNVTFNDAGNLRLASQFVGNAEDTITLIADGTNWYEISRSIN